MSIDVSAAVTIDRPREIVAAFLADPANDLRWIRALTRSERLTEPPTAVGTRVRRVARMMGRTIDYTTEVGSYEPGRLIEMTTVDGPFPMRVTYLTEDAGAGQTLVTVRNQGGSGMMFSIFSPLIGRMVNSRVNGDLAALKAALEAQS